MRIQIVFLSALLFSLLSGIGAAAATEVPEDAGAVRAEMERVLLYLDAPAYAAAVSIAEHVVLCYQLAQNRDPEPEEFLLLSDLCDKPAFRRSQVLAAALGGGAAVRWDQCRTFLERSTEKQFHAKSSVSTVAKALTETSLSRVREKQAATRAAGKNVPPATSAGDTPEPPHEIYNVYFGYLHAHSSLSDGVGTAEEAYRYARDEGKLDYFALTDHSEFLVLWPWEDRWGQLRQAAEDAYEPGAFVTLWGFEWSNPFLGHITVLNTTGIISALDHFFLPEFYAWLSRQPEALGTFNHPGRYDTLHTEFRHLDHFPDTVEQMVGIEVANTRDGFDEYYYGGGWNTTYSYWDERNRQGWKLGPVTGEDNHHADWGTKTPWRTAVLARELTREALIDAYRRRRFYATEDVDLRIDFRCAGYPMGSRLDGVPAVFTVDAVLESGASLQHIRLFRNGDLLETRPVSGNAVQATLVDLENPGHTYYYVIVTASTDKDGNGRNDEAISAPIWLGETAEIPVCGLLSFSCAVREQCGLGDAALLLLSVVVLLIIRKWTPVSGTSL